MKYDGYHPSRTCLALIEAQSPESYVLNCCNVVKMECPGTWVIQVDTQSADPSASIIHTHYNLPVVNCRA